MSPNSDKLLVLDVDGTLIYSSLFLGERPPDFKVGLANVWKRPGVEGFLVWCLEQFHVGIWTSATKPYVAEVLNHLVTDFHAFAFVYAREMCFRDEVSIPILPSGSGAPHSGYVPGGAALDTIWVKDLGILLRQGCQAEQIIVVDDSPESWVGYRNNVMPVSKYRGQATDDELARVRQVLERVSSTVDTRVAQKSEGSS